MSMVLAVLLFVGLVLCVPLEPTRWRELRAARGRPARRLRPRPPRPVDLGMLVVEVAALLRAGQPAQYAWGRALARHGLVGPPSGAPELAADGQTGPAGAGAAASAATTETAAADRGARGTRAAESAAPGAPPGASRLRRRWRRLGQWLMATLGSPPVPTRAAAGQGDVDDAVPPALLDALRQARAPAPLSHRFQPAARARRAVLAGALPGVIVACRVSATVGAPLATVLDQVADSITRAGETADERRVQLAGPLATARLLRCLPPCGLLLGLLLGANPLVVLTGSFFGWACLMVGGGLALAGSVWIGRIVAAAEAQQDRVDPAVLVDVARACLQVGCGVPGVVRCLGLAARDPALSECGHMLLLGAPWAAAWAEVDSSLQPLAAALEPAWVDGAAPGALLARAAHGLRATRVRAARTAAAELGTKLLRPLAVCLLPSFIALGIVPVILGGVLAFLG
ncbi:hypothetical protein [Buchananella hordeovulneris]|uniref:hypothetical protein n=1 Tax=Buchananella hordeovulneris TaxID=52770 RepID=UPI0026DDB51E|nr:hypothetical protein [Buchananella hordeovulneris]